MFLFNRQKMVPPTKTAIDPALEKTVHDWSISFGKYLKNHLMMFEGAVLIEDMTLKVQGQHFLDFTLHHVQIRLDILPIDWNRNPWPCSLRILLWMLKGFNEMS